MTHRIHFTSKHLSFVLRIFHSQMVTQGREKPRLMRQSLIKAWDTVPKKPHILVESVRFWRM